MQTTIYLDYAAATPMDPMVFDAMRPYFTDKFHNPSALYLDAKNVAKDIAAARAVVASYGGVRPAEVIFTAGGTEANNLAIRGVMERFPEANCVVSAIEHESVLAPAQHYAHRFIPVNAAGIVDTSQLAAVIDEATVLVSVMYANNEIGTVQPIKQLATYIQQVRQQRKKAGNKLPIYLHSDACQAAQYLDMHMSRLGIDLMTMNGGKLYGPKQVGALFALTGVDFASQILGGGQEWGRRSGTENVAGIVGLAKAVSLVQASRHDEVARLKQLQTLWAKLLNELVPSARLNGSRKHRLPSNVHITIPGQDNERLIMALDEAGIQAAAGSACSASNEKPSHVLKAIGLSDAETQASLRFTMGKYTTEQAVRQAVEQLALLVASDVA